jgi:DNA-binding LytR/AlgR family response regulator
MKLNCIIVEDEPVARKLLEEYIEDVDFLQFVGAVEHPVKASSLLLSERVDLMFLDINLPRMSGIDFLRTSTKLPMTVLTTAYTDYALQGFDLDVLDYLVKPFSSDRFLKACIKAREYAELKRGSPEARQDRYEDGYFFVKCDGRFEKILFDELVYAEAMANYVVLHMEQRKLLVYLTLKGILEQLPSDVFIKIHKSTVINSKKVKSIDGNMVNLGKAVVAISQNLQDAVMKEILKDRVLKR